MVAPFSMTARELLAGAHPAAVGWGIENDTVMVEDVLKEYYVYIMTNRSRTLYTGVTNSLRRRVYEHKHKLVFGFTQKYNITLLVYYEATPDVRSAIEREKQIKGWVRSKKIRAHRVESIHEWHDERRLARELTKGFLS